LYLATQRVWLSDEAVNNGKIANSLIIPLITTES
jgi:hypothetical protein